MMISKRETIAAETAARAKAQKASVELQRLVRTNDGTPSWQVDYDAADAHYRRCIRELEEAMNAAGEFETGDSE